MNHILVAIVAAPDTRRVGVPKLCLPWARTTILGHVIDRWREAGAQDVVVVHGQGRLSAVTQELDRQGVPADQRAANMAPARGAMGAMITAARYAQHNPFLSHLIVTLGDQPQVRTATLHSLLGACEASPGKVVRPVFRGRPGHPCALPVQVVGDLATTAAVTFSEFLDSLGLPIVDLACHDSGIFFEMDVPAELERSHRFSDAALTQPILT